MNYKYLVMLLPLITNTLFYASQKPLSDVEKNHRKNKRERLAVAETIRNQHKFDEFTYFTISPEDFLKKPLKNNPKTLN